MQKSTTLSFKKYFFIVETITIILILSILVISIFLYFNSILKSTIEKQNITLNSFINGIEFLKNHSLDQILNIKNEKDLKEFSNFAPNEFLEIFTLNRNYIVKKIFRKAANSKIFEGFSFENLYLKEFIVKNQGFAFFTTDIIRTIDDNISFYNIKFIDSDTYLVIELKINNILNIITSQIKIPNSMFIIANKNRYIIFNSSSEIELFFIPEIRYKHFVYIEDKPYFILSLSKGNFNNNLAIIIPFYSMFKSMFKYIIITFFIYLILIIFLFIFLILKNIMNNKYFIYPLSKTASIIANWNIKELENEIPKFFLGFQEISNLAHTLIKKYFEFTKEYEQLQEAEKTIKNMQKYLKNLIDSLPSAIISVDLQGKIIQWNKKAEEITGKKIIEVSGKNYKEVFPYLKKFESKINDVIKKDEIARIEKDFIDENNEQIVNINIIPISQNGLSGVAFRIDDISEIDKLEQQVRQSQKLEIVGLLAGGIAHDFNNALTGIISTNSLIKELLNENPSLKNPELVEYIDILENSATRAKDIVQKLLALSRKKEGKKVAINLQTCLNDVERICKSTLDKSVEIKFTNPFSEAIIMGEQNLIVQAILNLCVNAAQAMTIMRKPGEKFGGLLNVKLEKANNEDNFIRNLKEKNSNNLDYWKITISDTGVGIAENLKDKIFEPFFTTKEAFYGSGIGLSTVKMIVQDHNGIIEFESKEGAGTSFFIYLPILKIEKFLEPVAFDGSVKKGSGLILVVDDEKLVRTITKTMLIKLGYSALIASNSEEAIMIFKKNMQSIKLIILDIAIPGKSGIEIIREIKKIKFTTKVLLISGLKVEENMSKIIENAADGFLPKPFTISELSNSVFNIIYKKNQN